MKRLLLSACLLIAAFPDVSPTAPASPPSSNPVPSTSSYAPHRVIVKLKSAANATDAAALRASFAAGVHARFPGIGAEVWDVKGAAVNDAVAALQRDPRVEFAEPDYIIHASAVFPHDPQFAQQWSLYNTGQPAGKADADIDAPEAWTTTPGATVIVGVIDSGVDKNHEDLAQNIFTNPGEIAGNGKDDDGNGYIDDVHGWDFVNL
ncbi:MAG TPA: subtilase, partial [Candidatus Krumholzibacteria bacterium]|nr:subtilase [Candidatus Krumholzibacteria bacterium]